MPSTYTTNNSLTLQATGENNNTWGAKLNDETIALIDTSLDGVVTLALPGTTSSLPISDGVASDGRNRILLCTGALAANHTITITPNDAEKWFFVQNNTTGGFNVIIAQGGGSGSTVTIVPGYSKIVRLDGTGTNANVTEALPSPAIGGNLNVAGTVAVTGQLNVTGAAAFVQDAAIHGVDVGMGGGSIATNTRCGDNALNANSSGANNTAVGAGAAAQITTGNTNTVAGSGALATAATASGNTAVGYQSLAVCTNGANSAFGVSSGSQITTGTGNVIIGSNTGSGIATSSLNIILSDGAGTSRLHVNSSGEASFGSTPVSNLAVDIPSTTKGFRPPCMTTTQRNAISGPPTGTVVYNTTTNKLNVYTGSAWEAVTSA